MVSVFLLIPILIFTRQPLTIRILQALYSVDVFIVSYIIVVFFSYAHKHMLLFSSNGFARWIILSLLNALVALTEWLSRVLSTFRKAHPRFNG